MIESWDGMKPFAYIFTDEPETAEYLRNHRKVRFEGTYFEGFFHPGQREVGWQLETHRSQLKSILACAPSHINQRLTKSRKCLGASQTNDLSKGSHLSMPAKRKPLRTDKGMHNHTQDKENDIGT
jgi:hypothetical protein